MTLPRAASLGVGSMIGAGIFAVLGEVGAIAGGSVWLAFVAGGVIALLNGYSYARLGATYPSAGGSVAYMGRAFGRGAVSGALSVYYYLALVVVMALVIRAFGTYGAALVGITDPSSTEVAVIAAAGMIGIIALNMLGSAAVGRAELLMVIAKLTGLALFVIAGARAIQPDLIASELSVESGGAVAASVALAFFAYAGFEVINNSAADLDDPKRQLPRALAAGIGVVIVVYVAISLVVFGSLPLADLLAAKDTALAEAARPSFGQVGFTLMAVTAVIATISAVNATLYGSTNVAYKLARDGRLPRAFERRAWHGASEGLLITGILVIALAALLDLSRVAGLASLAFLTVYMAVTLGHLRLRSETGARTWLLVTTLVATGAAAAVFIWHLAMSDPIVLAGFAVTIFAAIAIEMAVARRHDRAGPEDPPAAHL